MDIWPIALCIVIAGWIIFYLATTIPGWKLIKAIWRGLFHMTEEEREEIEREQQNW